MNTMTPPLTEYTIPPADLKPKPGYEFSKRCFDIAASLVLGAVLLLPVLLIALLIRLDSPGPALHRQERLGRGGKPFIMYKFRSMYVNAEENGPQWADRTDWRCTPFGRFLRKSRLDELPQLLNILRGDMSFVGPRPERAFFYDQFEQYIHGFRNRLAVRPGLTGYAQVNGGYDLRPEEKIVFDMYYISHRGMVLDMICLLKTFRLLFTHEGAR